MGTDAEVTWIRDATTSGRTIASAIPRVFDAYATIPVPREHAARVLQLQTLLQALDRPSPGQPWWLGYLETGTDDVVLPDAPRVSLYADWKYVLVRASPREASLWRGDPSSWRAPGPDLVFPADRSWLLSWLWDDDWRCVGGSVPLVGQLLRAGLSARQVDPDEDATPPGHAVW